MKTRALVLCDDLWHSAATVRRGFNALGECGFEFEFLEDGRAWSAERMKPFLLVILAKANAISSRDKTPWLSASDDGAFLDFVRAGGGLLCVHGGVAGYGQLPRTRTLVGGAFVRHPDQCDVTFVPQAGHPLAACVESFIMRDEQYFVSLDAARVDVFLHSRSEHGAQPAGWTRTEGRGRVVALTPGHNVAVWLHPCFQKLLLNSLRWAAMAGQNT